MSTDEPGGTAGGEMAPIAREGEHVAPAVSLDAYHCPMCGVLAHQEWRQASYPGFRDALNNHPYAPVRLAQCMNCRSVQVWVAYGEESEDYRLVKPLVGGGPRPHVDLPDDV